MQISQPGLTMMACPEKIAAQEHQYLKNLADINFFLLQEDKLQLLDAYRQVRLIYQNLPPLTLEQTAWQMTGINNGTGGVVSSAQTGKANLQFKDGKLQGNSGCNVLTASYQINVSELIIGSVSSTRKLCPEEDLMTQEQQLLQALTLVTHYQIRANQLRLVNAGGSLMLSLKRP
ncbi:MAG: META domain-containing protein [Candidatus Methanofishera endochildressiae]|uniref:META domain-containing protein n=1 Tax=Candidatus Methanofishera endochildressiae TaxID=2738884 RepID=A0A7Z0MNJ2_9GAMM|nr:META domain-containing protein [Candidatus Methanofishera endochildressiae]